ncbi:hypothetical protein [Azospirillum argentinense]
MRRGGARKRARATLAHRYTPLRPPHNGNGTPCGDKETALSGPGNGAARPHRRSVGCRAATV